MKSSTVKGIDESRCDPLDMLITEAVEKKRKKNRRKEK